VTAGTKHTQATLLTALQDVRMAVDYRVGAGPNQLAGLVVRFVDENNHYLLMFYQNTLQFYRRSLGAYKLLATSPPLAPIAAGSTQRLEVRAAGGLLTGLWNGVPVVAAADTSFSNPAARRYGLDWNPSYDPTAAFDNFELYNLGP
jgi:hypothetical protein